MKMRKALCLAVATLAFVGQGYAASAGMGIADSMEAIQAELDKLDKEHRANYEKRDKFEKEYKKANIEPLEKGREGLYKQYDALKQEFKKLIYETSPGTKAEEAALIERASDIRANKLSSLRLKIDELGYRQMKKEGEIRKTSKYRDYMRKRTELDRKRHLLDLRRKKLEEAK